MKTEALDRILRVITVMDLMTDAKYLKRADTFENAQNLFNEYDVVPYPKKGNIEGYFHKDNKELLQIAKKNLVSSDTNTLSLFKIIKEDKFCFVLSANEIEGYIHYSDLNKPFTKIPLFTIFEAVERSLWENIKNRINEEDLAKLFSESEVKNFLKSREFNTKRNVNVDWTGIFTFPFILKMARYYGLIDFSDQEIKLLKETRNKVAHSDRNLINSFKDVEKLINAQELCFEIIK